jgi:hypothetical protein
MQNFVIAYTTEHDAIGAPEGAIIGQPLIVKKKTYGCVIAAALMQAETVDEAIDHFRMTINGPRPARLMQGLEPPKEYDPDYPYQPVLDGPEPLPDPAWAYTEVYARAIAIERELTSMLSLIREAEEPDNATDEQVTNHLRQIEAQVCAAMEEI